MIDGLTLFFRFCQARSSLYDSIKQRINDENSDIYDVSSHSIFDIFEFLYMLSATKIDSGGKIALLANAHNAECQRLLDISPTALARMGLNKTKLGDSMFSEKNIKKLRSNFDFSGAIDQSDISRFLFKHMSRETARKVLILFDRAELVKRIDAGDSILIKPNGQAEQVFEQYLTSLMLPTQSQSETT